MPAKRSGSAHDQEKDILRALARQVEDNADTILRRDLDEIEDTLTKLYNRTTAGWEGRSDSGIYGPIHPRPTPTFEYKKLKVSDDLEISFRIDAHMADPGGSESDLWAWIDRGTDFTMPKKSAPFKIRKSNRTFTDSLDPGSFPGYQIDDHGKPRMKALPAGYRVLRPGTGWTNMIGKQFKQALQGKRGMNIRFQSIGRRYIGGV